MKISSFYFSIILLCIVLCTSCEKHGFTVNGEFQNANYLMAVLEEVNPYEIIPLDTVLLINGKLKHKVNAIEKSFYRLRFADTVTITFIAGNKDNIFLEGDLSDIKNTQKVKGNEESVLFLEVNKKIHEMYMITDSLSKIFVQYKDSEQFDSIRIELDSCYYRNFRYYKSYLQDFILQHPNKLASISAFHQKIGHRAFFNRYEDRELAEKLAQELSIAYPENKHFIAFKERLEYE
ncbi:MAG: DUF4369 domain-containing protein [Bacteroidales bacterium]|jgi:hypothetical protein|nr:DUF4369 domain-containing protein [Bacteroidales bacterium]MDD2688345.1 DUF4369 domain-containing protein [Bacteroidales bacterium]MDD3330837.1 DUF4369 domain-containing protein [Bacteroidales bacterium]MDD3691336.1 DUF4369 domain-containing protein [Bacteroidales bacterium]MDD4044528.1 DUF4369 domain-containing protein [Bacteroidales bacterium]